MFEVKLDGKRAIIDLRDIILKGGHPRRKVFQYITDAEIDTILEIHTPRYPKPLVKGLEDLGLRVVVDELSPDHVRVVTVKLNEI